MTGWDEVLRITLYGPGFETRGWVGEWDKLDVTARAIGAGSASWVCPADVDAADALLTPGCRGVVDYRPAAGLAWTRIASGRVVAKASGPSVSADLGVTLVDDWSHLDVLAWPVPAAAITAQSSVSWTASGPGEDVAVALVAAAATRLGIPLTTPASAHRGDPVSTATRFGKVSDLVAQIAATAGLTAVVRQVGSGLQLLLGVGTDRRGIALSETSDTVADWEWQISPPTLTRVVVGGSGSGTGKALITVADTAAEALWGVKLEDFVDAGDTGDTSALTAKGQAVLDVAAARIDGLRITLSESESWRYCAGIREGDAVRVELIPGRSRDSVITEVRVQASTDAGITVTPVVGDPTVGLPERVQAQIIAGLGRGIRELRAR